MSLPGNGIFVVRGEISVLLTAMRRGSRWASHLHQDDDEPLVKRLHQLKEILNKTDDLRLIDSLLYLMPFLDVIRSEETTGPVTSLALSALNKFLSYGLIDPTHNTIPITVHKIADAVTHARFVGTDQSSDAVVLMRILQVLRTLTLAPEGAHLTNESLCEIMLSCFRISFETRLNELLRRTAEHYLKDMVQLVFMRLPQFSIDLRSSSTIINQQFKMRPGSIEQTRVKRKKSFRLSSTPSPPPPPPPPPPPAIVEPTLTEKEEVTNIVDMQNEIINLDENETIGGSDENEEKSQSNEGDYVNQRGIRFTTKPVIEDGNAEQQQQHIFIPYGLACVRELFRFLISLCNRNDKQNTDGMMHLGLTLLAVAFEIGADSIGKYAPLLGLVKNELCRNLFSLLTCERLGVFSANLQVCFLIFESLRTHLKYQLEFYLTKLIDIIVSDSGKISYEHKEIALDNIIQLWRIPGLVSELYLNYDCNMYCTNLYEDLTKLLAKNAFSATSGGVYHTHMLSLDALLTVIENIQQHNNRRIDEEKNNVIINEKEEINDGIFIENIIEMRNLREKTSEILPSKAKLMSIKEMKRWLPMGTEHFNHKPKKGIQFLQEHGVLNSKFDPNEVASFLRENSLLDKQMIGEYLGSRGNDLILSAFMKTFDFSNTRIDEALRYFLETFRLPGEAPIISQIMEHFAAHWHKSNGEPFGDVDAAFTLAYAVIILNVDQHNQNAKKQATPMTTSGFKKNLKGVNGGNDFNDEMLQDIYNAIRNEEIIMPAEQIGLVRENYLWKVLLRKGESNDGQYYHLNNGEYDRQLFDLLWAPIVAALAFVYDKAEEEKTIQKAIDGFSKCAYISSHFGIVENLDALVLTLAKFTTFYNISPLPQQSTNRSTIISFGSNLKARLALKLLTNLCHQYGDNVRQGWKHLFDVVLSLFSLNLLPKSFCEAEDFIENSGRITLTFKEPEYTTQTDNSLFSSLYSYMMVSTGENQSRLTIEEQTFIDQAKDIIKECNFELLITDSKFLHDNALKTLIDILIELSHGPDAPKSTSQYNESVGIFYLELLLKIVIQNRDRVITIWQNVHNHIYTLVMNSSIFDYKLLLQRSVVGLLRIAIRLMRNEEMSPIVLQSMRMLLLLKSGIICRISRQVAFGLNELLKTSAQNIHTKGDWMIVFTLLECVGAGAPPPKPIDDDSTESKKTINSTLITNGWILIGGVGNECEIGRTLSPNQYSLLSFEQQSSHHLGRHDPYSLIKCCESLAFLVRDVAHITPYNFDDCVHCIRTFVEASSMMKRSTAFRKKKLKSSSNHQKVDLNNQRQRGKRTRKRKSPTTGLISSSGSSGNNSEIGDDNESGNDDDDDDDDDDNNDDHFDEDDLPSGYHQISIQLLDLMHTLHTRTAQIFKWWAEEGGTIAEETSLWTQGWCPLLQGIARLCCDVRREIRMNAITYLQRALLVHDLQTLTGTEWSECFHRVLFPLLGYLLNSSMIEPNDPIAMEETRMRAATVLSKVFLHHLTPLLSLPTFANLWLIILDLTDKYMHADGSDLLNEAIPESLKNMLLVMDSAKVFDDGEDGAKGTLWTVTWERINQFLPGMKEEIFKEIEEERKRIDEPIDASSVSAAVDVVVVVDNDDTN